jgi:transposase
MIETPPPLAPALRPTVSAPAPAPLLEQLATLRRENAALRGQNAAVQERIGELEDRLGQHSANSSRPPSADPPQAPARPKAPRSGGKRGGQPGHHGAYRELLPVEQVDEVVVVVPEVCRHCGQPFLCSEGRGRVRPWRHQVVELLPLAVWVTEFRVDRHRGGAVVDALLGSDFRESGQPVPEAKKWWPALWTFARAEGVEPTNNGAERGLRPAVL